MKRGETSGRSDDNAESIKKRLVTFKEQTLPVLAFFGSRVRSIDAEADISVITQKTLGCFKDL